MKKIKTDKSMLIGVGVTLALILTIGLTSLAKADISLIDRLLSLIAPGVQKQVGDAIVAQIPKNTGETIFGAFPGSDIYNDVRFHDSVTIDQSPDGFVVTIPFVVATTTYSGKYLNDTNNILICDGETASVNWRTPNTFVPNLKFSVGTTTSGYSATEYGVIASTTMATSTAASWIMTDSSYAYNFMVATSGAFVIDMSDNSGYATVASSTYYSSIDAVFDVHCWETELGR